MQEKQEIENVTCGKHQQEVFSYHPIIPLKEETSYYAFLINSLYNTPKIKNVNKSQ